MLGGEHIGSSPSHQLWMTNGRPFEEGDATLMAKVPGLVTARLIGQRSDGALVATPDGFIGWVENSTIRPVPARPIAGT